MSPQGRLIQALLAPDARLLIAEDRGSGPEVRLAHEALLQNWPRAKAWVEENRRDIESEALLRALMRVHDLAPEHECYRHLLSGAHLELGQRLIARGIVSETSDLGRFIAKSSKDRDRIDFYEANGTLSIYDLATGLLTRMSVGDGPVTSIGFSPDGAKIVMGTAEGSISIWDARTLRLLLTLQGQTGTIRRMAFSADGRLIASGGTDNTARVWSTETGQMVVVVRADAPVVGLAFSLDGARLIVSAAKGAIYVIDTRPGKPSITSRHHRPEP
jgi:tricorn protease-like protein